MELGTIIIPGNTPTKTNGQAPPNGGGRTNALANYPVAYWNLVGESILQRTVGRLRASGARLITVVHPDEEATADVKHQGWEKVFLEYVRTGVERVLLISLDAYAEFDLEHILRFHRQAQCPVTHVVDEDGPLGISVIEAKCVAEDVAQFRRRLSAFTSCSSTYEFNGYVKRLDGAPEYRQLVQHALLGICKARPVGKEVRPGIWMGEGARVSASARLLGPCYVGAHTKVRAGALVMRQAAIEQNCEIDCGTVVEGSSILPRTYVGPGLHISQSVVSGSRLVHLGRQLDVELGETGLLGRTGPSASLRILESLGSLFGNWGPEPATGTSTPSRAPASVEWVRSNGFFG
ncbi:MAG: hypothetical protein DMG68_05460 [Acidobacteria bacterium]|nr:MAG: hypothetical protein DMG68_05460 [Acidobacteriota bacterium]